MVATLTGVGAAQAQSVLKGRVRADSTHRPIAGAEVLLQPVGRSARTDAEGEFHLADLPAGRLSVVVRAIGYRALGADAELGPHDSLDVVFELSALPVELAPIRVEAAAPRFVSGKMTDFERRRSAGFGAFLSRAQLAKQEHADLSDVLRKVAGARLLYRPTNCGGGFAIGTGRSEGKGWMCGAAPFPPACYMTIYLDGALWWDPGMRELPPDINQFYAHSLQGIEIYRGPSEVPIQYQATGSACGVALLWTRTGEEPDTRPSRRPPD